MRPCRLKHRKKLLPHAQTSLLTRLVCSVRRADGSSETVRVKDKAHLEELLSGIFGIKLPENTEDIDRYLVRS